MATITTVDTPAFPGQSRTITGENFGITQLTGSVTIGGFTQTVTSWGNTSITFTTVLSDNSYGTGKVLEVDPDLGASDTTTIELVADTASGFGVVTLSSPATTDSDSVCFGQDVVTGDQFEWEDNNNLGNLSVDAQGFATADTPGELNGRFWTSNVWRATETFHTVENMNGQNNIINLIYSGNLTAFDNFEAAGVTKGNFNERALKYFRFLGATANAFNTALKQVK